jgi:hypothetical protein
MPCTGIVPFTGNTACFCANPPDSVSTLVGDESQLYDVTFLIRGVIEFGKYTGGTIIAGTGSKAVSGGTPVADGHNHYSLLISNPVQTIRLNNWDGVSPYGTIIAVRYSLILTVNSGATITLRADNGGDGIEVSNLTNVVLPYTPGDPAFNPSILPQPYQTPGTLGQGTWMQADAISIA